MRVVIQRASASHVSVAGNIVGEIEGGLVVLAGITHHDTLDVVMKMARKIAGLRIFNDDAGKMNRSVLDVGAEVLVISQFTLYADARRGRRPSYTDAAPPEIAEPLVDEFVRALKVQGIRKVATGVFGADMLVSIQNDGPVTIILEM